MRHNSHNIDFAALRVLRLVFEYRSFSAAAEHLHINQSAVSYTIDKLRKVFDDPLFVRQGASIVATERCATIVEAAIRMLNEYEALSSPPKFDPSTLDHTFTIASNYYERQLILPHLVRRLDELAPNVRLELINSTAKGHLQLKRSEAEILIGPLRPEGGEFYCRRLLQERYVCIMDPSHPMAGTTLTLDTYVASKHALVTYGGTWKSLYLLHLEALGLELDQVLSVPSPAGLPEMLRGTGIIATVPWRIAQSFGPSVQIAESPCPAPFDIDLVWTSRTHRSAMHFWLRELIVEETRRNVTDAHSEPG